MTRFRPAILLAVLACLVSSSAWAKDKSSSESKQKEAKTDAQKYAAALDRFLSSVNKQVADKIAAEETFYKTTSAIYVQNYSQDMLGNLALDGIEGASSLALEMAEAGGANSDLATQQRLQALREALQAQAQRNIEAMRRMLGNERDIQNSYLASVADLDAAEQKIHALSGALRDLSAPIAPSSSLKELEDYASDVKDAFVKDSCADLDSEVADLTARQQAIQKSTPNAAKSKGLQSRIDALSQFKKDNCSETKTSATKAAGASEDSSSSDSTAGTGKRGQGKSVNAKPGTKQQ